MVWHEGKFELLCHTAGKLTIVTWTACHLYPQYFEYTTRGGTIITPCQLVRDLGVHVTPNLSWTPHINILADKGRQLIAWVLSVFSDRTELTMMTLYRAIIRSRLEYLSPLWHPSKIEDIKTLEGVQRLFTSKISGLSELSYWQRLKKLKLMSLQRRRERFIIISIWKIFNGTASNDLNIEKTYSERRGLRAVVPPLCKSASAHCQTLYDQSFAITGPKLWNCLPTKLTTITTKTTFKSALAKHLDQITDHPPVEGVASDNSILDMNRLKMMGGPAAATSRRCADDLC